MSRRSSHVASAASYAVRLAARSPQGAADLVRTVGGLLLDRQFEERSPLRPLPRRHADALGREPVCLPPLRFFAPGNQDLQGLVHLASLARAIGARTIFEIGTYNGLTALTLARNARQAIVHTLDLEPGQRPTLPVFEEDFRHIGHGDTARVYQGTAQSERIVQHLGDSATFDFSGYARSIELVYVDGAHSREYVSSDSEAAFSMVTKEGAIVWDDYWRQVPDVPWYLHSIAHRTLYRLPASRLVMWLSEGARDRLLAARN